jgi:hypothetical protein
LPHEEHFIPGRHCNGVGNALHGVIDVRRCQRLTGGFSVHSFLLFRRSLVGQVMRSFDAGHHLLNGECSVRDLVNSVQDRGC